MRIVFAGTPEVAVPSLRALVAAGHEVAGVITRPDAPLGRKRVLTPSPVAVAAEDLGIEVLKAHSLGEAETAWVAGLGVRLGVIVAYGGLVRAPLLATPELGWINLHFSQLPRWRGAAPVQRALMAGEDPLGVTVFQLVEALDAGDVLTRDAKSFAAGTSAGAALAALAESGTDALLRAVAGLDEGTLVPQPQLGEANYAHKLDRSDGQLDLSQPASEVLSHWAGVTPEPGAFVMHEGQPLKLTELQPCEPSEEEPDAAPGVASMRGKNAVIGTGRGVLTLSRVQPAGKTVMNGADWLRGRGGSAQLS